MNYRRMEATALVVFGACAAVLGFATAVFDLTETQAMVLFVVYLIGGLPAILYLHFIAKAQRNSSRTRTRPKSANLRYALWAPPITLWIVLAVRADDPVTRWLWAGVTALAVVVVAFDWWRHRKTTTQRPAGTNDT
ncbi:hypothetical protein VVR84_14690 [Kocuria carniphila]|uniref:hypothetical protein n=1 Tax=Kocuria carniphila TaxID=262208 RepID=UPI0034CDD2A6